MEFNHADLFEGVADALPDRIAAVCGPRRLTFAELDAEANRLAHYLEGTGVGPGDHVGIQLYNGIEYIVTMLAALKLRAVPVNVNYRYVTAELRYIYNDSDLAALVYGEEFAQRVGSAVPPSLRRRISVGGARAGSADAATGVVSFAEALAGQSAERGFGPRSPDDLYIIYTGGTTGMPKGVMWRSEDLFMAFGGGNPSGEPHTEPAQVVEFARSFGHLVMMAAAPLMHGAAQMATFIGWWMGATLVYTPRFDAAEVLTVIGRERVVSINITGDAMARPLAEELAVGSYDMSWLAVISSTGAILSGAIRDRLQEMLPNVMILDNFGSSESGYTASAVEGSTPESGLKYRPTNAALTVLDDALTPVQPGSGVIGQVAKSGHIAFGYYNDPAKTARTFVSVGGVRWLLTGDIATVEEDGAIAIYGRGSQCINTGGEKVYPEEIEAVLKGHPDVFDAVVTGIPDDRFGSRVAAVVQGYPDRPAPVRDDLDAHCRAVLSGYKVPRTYAIVDEVVRSPAGKADYRWAKRVAEDVARA